MRNPLKRFPVIGYAAVASIAVGTTLLVARGEDNTASSRAPIHCDSPSFDLGSLYRPTPKTLRPTFRIKNTSQAPVAVRVAGTSCACSKGKVEKTPLALQRHFSTTPSPACV